MRAPLLLLTDRHQLPPGRLLVEQVAGAVDAGVHAVLLRERDLDDRERADLAAELAPILTAAGGHLIVAAPEVGRPHGVHLRADDPLPPEHAPVVGRSCHGAEELHWARAEGVDYVLLGPVAPTASKPGYGPAVGVDRFARLVRQHHGRAEPGAPAPRVYALGGVDADNAAGWVAAGADGVAVMGALMRADDPALVATELLATLPTECVG